MAHLVAFLFVLVIAALYMLCIIPLKLEQIVTISIALVGWVIGVDFLFLQIRLSMRHQLETKAIADITKAVQKFSTDSASPITFSNDFVAKPLHISKGFWFEEAAKKHQRIAEETIKIREGYGGIYYALETHEIAIIHLEHIYRFVTIRIGDYVDQIDEANSKFLRLTNNYDLTESQYKKAVEEFKPLQDTWANLAAYLMDFRKIMQNELLGTIFKRQLLPRRPQKGYGTTLEVIATPSYVKKLIEEREKEFTS